MYTINVRSTGQHISKMHKVSLRGHVRQKEIAEY